MAGPSVLLERIRATVAHLDDEALVALANKGMVRRARKDLETTRPSPSGPHREFFRFQFPDCTVDLAESPAQSQCSCQATGICRHILAVLLFLRESSPETPVMAVGEGRPTPLAGEEILALIDATILKWCGKALFRRAVQALARGMAPELEETGPVIIRFPVWNIVCRCIPGGGLEGMICSCHLRGPCEHRVAAILAYQTAKGNRELARTEATDLKASVEAPRTREEVLDSLGAVLREMVSLGLSRLSGATADRLRTLAVSAHGVDLPRLERMLRALAEEAALFLARDAQADSATLLATAARIEALRIGLRNPSPPFVGVHRSQYDRVGDIELAGMGARQWRTRSGYTGLTVYFWDHSAHNWATWTEARPSSVGDFDPASRFSQEGPWIACPSPEKASRSTLRLMGAWRNRAGRLSGRSSTRAMILGDTKPTEIPGPVSRWTELVDRARRLFGGGLQEHSEQDEIVYLEPKGWSLAQFDSIRQELIRSVFDCEGRLLPLVLPFTPQTQEAVKTLEKHDPTQTFGLLGIFRLSAARLAVEPIALYENKRIVNLSLDSAVAAVSSGPVVTEESEEKELEEIGETAASATGLGLLLTRMAEELESLSEGGLLAGPKVESLRMLAAQADSVGVASCARCLTRLADQLEQVRKSVGANPAAAAETLLQAHYVIRFAAAQEAIATATAPLLN